MLESEQFYRTVRKRIETIAEQLAAERLGFDPQSHRRKDEETIRQWNKLRLEYTSHALNNLANVLAGLATMDLETGPESPAPPPHLL